MRKNRAVGAAQYMMMLLAVLIILFPIYWMAASAFKTPGDIISYPLRLFPSTLRLKTS